MHRKYFFLLGIVPMFLFLSMYIYSCSVDKSLTLNEVPTKVLNAFKEKNQSVLLADWRIDFLRNKKVYEAIYHSGANKHHDYFDESGHLIKSR